MLCILLSTGGLAAAYFSIPQEAEPHQKAKVGVINLDQNPLSLSVMESLLEGERLSSLIELSVLPPDPPDKEGYTAILTLPEGFLESILNGTNLSPVVEINEVSPLEAMWVRQLATAGASALSEAQYGIYAVLEKAGNDPRVNERTYQLLVADVNLRLLNAFFDRISQLKTETLSASGVLTLPEYYLSAIGAALVFCYGFFFFPSVEDLRLFSKASGRRWPPFLAGMAHVLALTALASLPLFLLASRGGNEEGLGRILAAWLLFSLLSTGTTVVCCLGLPTRAACAAGCILLTLGQALCGGLLLPLALLPAAFTPLASFLPVRRGMELLGSAMKPEMAAGWIGSGVMAVLLLLLGAVLWHGRSGSAETGFRRGKGGWSR